MAAAAAAAGVVVVLLRGWGGMAMRKLVLQRMAAQSTRNTDAFQFHTADIWFELFQQFPLETIFTSGFRVRDFCFLKISRTPKTPQNIYIC